MTENEQHSADARRAREVVHRRVRVNEGEEKRGTSFNPNRRPIVPVTSPSTEPATPPPPPQPPQQETKTSPAPPQPPPQQETKAQ
jgi:type IV secretory pathway VirB10-like protein